MCRNGKECVEILLREIESEARVCKNGQGCREILLPALLCLAFNLGDLSDLTSMNISACCHCVKLMHMYGAVGAFAGGCKTACGTSKYFNCCFVYVIPRSLHLYLASLSMYRCEHFYCGQICHLKTIVHGLNAVQKQNRHEKKGGEKSCSLGLRV